MSRTVRDAPFGEFKPLVNEQRHLRVGGGVGVGLEHLVEIAGHLDFLQGWASLGAEPRANHFGAPKQKISIEGLFGRHQGRPAVPPVHPELIKTYIDDTKRKAKVDG